MPKDKEVKEVLVTHLENDWPPDEDWEDWDENGADYLDDDYDVTEAEGEEAKALLEGTKNLKVSDYGVYFLDASGVHYLSGSPTTEMMGGFPSMSACPYCNQWKAKDAECNMHDCAPPDHVVCPALAETTKAEHRRNGCMLCRGKGYVEELK